MTKALSILRGGFGRVALLDMDISLVDHAHPHCHLILKVDGPDQNFVVEGKPVPLRSDALRPRNIVMAGGRVVGDVS